MFILRGEINGSCEIQRNITDNWPLQTTIHGTLAGGPSLSGSMSNIKPVNCGKTTLEFELKIKVLYEKLPVIEIDLTYRTFT